MVIKETFEPPRNAMRYDHVLFGYFCQARVDANDLAALDDALKQFHNCRTIFQECSVRPTGFNLPRQHSLIHYHTLIKEFGAPNGLCSSITESKHIKAVKEPWRRSSRFNALGQMLLINQQLDNLAASRVDFASRGMLEGTCLSNILDQLGMSILKLYFLILRCTANLFLNYTGHSEPDHDVQEEPVVIPQVDACAQAGDKDDDEGDVAGPRVLAHTNLAKTISKLPLWSFDIFLHLHDATLEERTYPDTIAGVIDQPDLTHLIRRFIHHQNQPDSDSSTSSGSDLPEFHAKTSVYKSAVATFYAPSDILGIGGMRCEWIHAINSWRKGPG